jgi:hypothetical protein
VNGYRIERCAANECPDFLEIATSVETAYIDRKVSPGNSYTYRVRATDAAENFSDYSNQATARTGVRIFFANFDSDDLEKPPNPALPGDPVGDSLTLNTAAGTILVRPSVGNLDKKPVELNQTGGTGGVDLRGTVAGTPPRIGIYTARWRSLVASREGGSAAVVLRDSVGRILASLAYKPNNIFDYNDRQPNGIGIGWERLIAQDFIITVDLDNKLTTLSVNGKVVLEDRFFDPAAADLARISMELGTTGTQTLAWDDVEISATVP